MTTRMIEPFSFRRLNVAVFSLVIALSISASASAAVQISLSAGYLRTASGTNLPVATSSSQPGPGALLLLVAAGGTNNTFTNQLSAGQYVAGNDTILASFSFNNFGGTNTGQTTINSVNFTLPSGVTTGTTLVELRWFPEITLSQYTAGTTPIVGNTYGVYNPSLYPALNGTSLNPDGGNTWVVPADGSKAYALNFFTTDNTAVTGTQAPREGYANFMVVPEPSAGTFAGLGLVVAAGAVRVWRRSASRDAKA